MDDLIGKEEIPVAMREQIMRMYDAAMCEQLTDSRMSQIKAEQLHARIEDGQLETYRFFNGSWTFDLKRARLKGRAFNSSPGQSSRDGRNIQNVHVVAVDVKVAELEQAPIEEAPLEASASGVADEGNTAATTADTWDDEFAMMQQFDGASDPVEPLATHATPACAAHDAASRGTRLPQLDGEDDDDDDWALAEDAPASPADDPLQDVPGGARGRDSSSALPASGFDSAEELNSDDDSDGGGGGGRGAQAVQYTNTVHAQFRKVKRQRNKWNCELTAGVATIDGLDYAFTKCDANFLF